MHVCHVLGERLKVFDVDGVPGRLTYRVIGLSKQGVSRALNAKPACNSTVNLLAKSCDPQGDVIYLMKRGLS